MDIKEEVVCLIDKEVKLSKSEIRSLIEIPPNPSLGDYAFPCFKLGGHPVDEATKLIEKIKKKSKVIEKIEQKGPYVNFFINKQILAEIIIKQVYKEKKCYGAGKNKKEKIMVEFSQPNPLKDFHVGHLRNTALGNSLVKILEFNGYHVIPVNLYNDTGAHVTKSLWGYLKYFKNKEPPGKEGAWLGKVYVKSIKKLKEQDHGEELAVISQKIEAQDPETIKLWKKLRNWSIDYFKEIYQELDIHFDVDFYDSDLIEPGKEMVQELLRKKIAKESEGAIIVDLSEYNLDIALVLRADGTALYITKDLALAKSRFEKYYLDRLIYVVGAEQKLHFKQLFKIIELYGLKQAQKCFHLSYGLVELPSGKMSSRLGNVVLYGELAEKLKKQITKEVVKRHKKWPRYKQQKSINNIFSAAIKFSMLLQENNKPVVFDLEKTMDFEGETGPYVQYAHARACSILRKAKQRLDPRVDYETFNLAEEIKVIKLLGKFPDLVVKAGENYKPYLIARYLIDLSQAFNEFYHKCPVISEMKHIMRARLLMVECTRQVLENGLALLGIKAPEEM
ncbi:MAG: arginine--tRNA ligase [Nanoarchaeota archaeon]|nr:arginine--tRNA ligase [Nanoarchaeota archaeon]